MWGAHKVHAIRSGGRIQAAGRQCSDEGWAAVQCSVHGNRSD